MCHASLALAVILNRRRAVMASMSTLSSEGLGTNFWLVPATSLRTSSSKDERLGLGLIAGLVA